MNNVKAAAPLSRRKKLLFYLLSYAFIAIVLFAFAEVIARLKGFRPYTVKQAEISVEPGGKFFRAHPTLGYTHLPGQYKITLAGTYTFRATNLENTLRVTHPLGTYSTTDARPQIWILGDSITYGWSVSDEEAYPWLLHEKLRDYEVVNFGVSGYGTLHSLIQLREAFQNSRTPPRVVILAYASWHDVRNTFIRIRRKMLAPSAYLGPLNQPYARLNRDGRLEIFMDTVEYREFPLMRHSAFVHALEETYDNYEEKYARSHEVTKAIIKEMIELCKAHGTELVLATLTADPTTSDMVEYCRGEGAKTVSIWVDMNNKENNNLPYDSHPSALAHQQYAQKLETFLRNNMLNKSGK